PSRQVTDKGNTHTQHDDVKDQHDSLGSHRRQPRQRQRNKSRDGWKWVEFVGVGGSKLACLRLKPRRIIETVCVCALGNNSGSGVVIRKVGAWLRPTGQNGPRHDNRQNCRGDIYSQPGHETTEGLISATTGSPCSSLSTAEATRLWDKPRRQSIRPPHANAGFES